MKVAECPFCAIARGELPAALLHEDEHCLVLLDLYPITRGHTLVISRLHAETVAGLPEAQYLHLQQVAQRVVAAHQRWDSSIQAHNWVINDGRVSGQHVPHVHLHLIPRRSGDKPASLVRLITRFHPFGMARRRAALEDQSRALRPLLNALSSS